MKYDVFFLSVIVWFLKGQIFVVYILVKLHCYSLQIITPQHLHIDV